jgi:hypothetical protein
MEYTGLERANLRTEFGKHHLILTTYGTVRRDIAVLKDFEFDYVVLDEAQTIKNPSSQIARASRLLKSNFRLALSGTPIENNAGDLWSIFEFLNPGMLGRSTAFRSHIADPDSKESRDWWRRDCVRLFCVVPRSRWLPNFRIVWKKPSTAIWKKNSVVFTTNCESTIAIRCWDLFRNRDSPSPHARARSSAASASGGLPSGTA